MVRDLSREQISLPPFNLKTTPFLPQFYLILTSFLPLLTSTLRAKGTLISEPRFSTPCEMRFFPHEKGKMAIVEGFSLVFPFSRGKNRISQGVENRGSLISVPLALREINLCFVGNLEPRFGNHGLRTLGMVQTDCDLNSSGAPPMRVSSFPGRGVHLWRGLVISGEVWAIAGESAITILTETIATQK